MGILSEVANLAEAQRRKESFEIEKESNKIKGSLDLLKEPYVDDDTKLKLYNRLVEPVNKMYGVNMEPLTEWDSNQYKPIVKDIYAIQNSDFSDAVKKSLTIGRLSNFSDRAGEALGGIYEKEDKAKEEQKNAQDVLEAMGILKRGVEGTTQEGDAERMYEIQNGPDGEYKVLGAISGLTGDTGEEGGQDEAFQSVARRNPVAALQAYKTKATQGKEVNEVELAGRKSEASELGKSFSKLYTSLQEDGAEAQEQLDTTRIFEEALYNAYTGFGSKQVAGAAKIAESLGIPISEAATATQVVSALSSKLAVQARRAGSREGQILAGAISENDLKELHNAVVGLDKSKAANLILSLITRQLANRKIKIASMAEEYREKNGTMDGFPKIIRQYAEENPMNFKFDKADIESYYNDRRTLDGYMEYREKVGSGGTITTSKMVENLMKDNEGMTKEEAINFIRSNRKVFLK